VRLVYFEACATVADALRREYELKQLPRAKKQELIRRSGQRAKGRGQK
jgi:predicted GIY-YIG superfamily endonuclease